jgi:hypothetical protein
MPVLTAMGLMFCLVDPAAAEAQLALSEGASSATSPAKKQPERRIEG